MAWSYMKGCTQQRDKQQSHCHLPELGPLINNFSQRSQHLRPSVTQFDTSISLHTHTKQPRTLSPKENQSRQRLSPSLSNFVVEAACESV